MDDLAFPSVTFPAEKLSTGVLLKRHSKEIIDIWAERVRSTLAVAQGHTKPTILDALPELMDQIVNALSLIGFIADKRTEIAKEHGQQRKALGGYTVKSVLTEMRLLRETIFEVLEKEGGPLAQRDRDIILDSIEKGIITTGAEFARLQIAEMTSDLDESNSTIEKLEAEKKLRDLFVSTLTHDLKTPLSAALLSTELMRRKFDGNPDLQYLVDKTEKSLKRVEGMIDVLLDANQIRAGQPLSLELKEYDLVKQVSDLLEEISEFRNRKFIFRSADHTIPCRFSYEKINRAIENLLTNAMKYGDPTQPITVDVKKQDGKAWISVHNFGNPILPEDQAAIFEPFFRSTAVRIGNQKGWGLGLTLVQGIVEAHGGRINLVSNSTQGTTFSLVLPLK